MFHFFSQQSRLERQRITSLAKCDVAEIKDYLAKPLLPLPTVIETQPLLAIDLETTGLKPKKDQILAIGGVEIIEGKIDLSTAFHQVVAVTGPLEPNNVSVHGITDQEAKLGLTLRSVLLALLKRAQGKHLLVHFADIEREFLAAAYQSVFGVKVPFQFVDTFEMGKHLLKQKDIPLSQSHLSLSGMRRRQRLPNFEPHNALNDAIATAELYLALKKSNN